MDMKNTKLQLKMIFFFYYISLLSRISILSINIMLAKREFIYVIVNVTTLVIEKKFVVIL